MAEDGTTGAPYPDHGQQPPQPGWQPPASGYGHQPPASGYGAQPAAGWGASPAGGYAPYQNPPPGGDPWMYGPYQQPPKKSRTGLIVGLAVGAAVLLAGGAVTVVALTGSSEHTTARNNGLFTPAASPTTPAPSTSPPKARTRPARSVTLRPPSSAAGYKQMKGSIVKRSLDAMRAQMGKLSDNAKIAIYSKGASRLVYIGISGADDRQIASELSRSPSSEVDAVFMGSGITNPKDYPTGSIGGVLRCGKTRQQASAVTICAWADSSAVITLEAGAITPQKLSSILLTFHNASIRTAVPGA